MQDDASVAAGYPPPARAWWALAVLFLAAVVSVIDRGILNIVVDPVRLDLGLSDIQISLLQGMAFGIFYATVGIPLGLIADRVSRRNLLAVGILVWSFATVGGGLASSFGSMFASRLLVGLGEAALGPAAVSLIADLFPPGRRGRPLGLYLAGQAIANGLAISLTGLLLAAAARGAFAGVPLLADAAPWRVAFIGCGLVGLVVVALMLTTREPARKGVAGASAGTSTLAQKIAFLRRHAGLFVPLYLGFAICFLAAYGSAAWAPTMLIRAFKLTPATIGAWLGPATMLFSVFGSLVCGTLIDRFARHARPTAKLVILVIAPLLAIPASLAIFSPSPLAAMILVASSSMIYPAVGAAVFATFQSTMPSDMRGSSIALAMLLNTLLGSSLGPLLIAAVTQAGGTDPAMAGYAIAIVTIPALIAASILFAIARRGMARSKDL